jgi:CheY-like chemotaxis protein
VLIVDDNATNRRLLDEFLHRWNTETELAASAMVALDVMRRNRREGRTFHIVLIDAQMPEVDGFRLAEEIRGDQELEGAIIMMLTSAGQHGDAARCRELGVAGYLTKPIRQAELRQAIERVLGKSRVGQPIPFVTRHSLREAGRSLRILLAEDNAVNQLLAKRVLEKQGHSTVVVVSGREALEALEKGTFDLVLMDVQMPDVDGFEATAAIRQRERQTGAHLPIIAMTAAAMQGDKERCLEAGMDAYLSKPINANELFAAIERAMTLTGA